MQLSCREAGLRGAWVRLSWAIMSNWIVKRGTLERRIPDDATLLRLVRERRLLGTDLVFHPSSQQWMNASEVPELRGTFAEVSGERSLDQVEAFGPSNGSSLEPATSAPQVDRGAVVVGDQGWGVPSRVLGIMGGSISMFGGFTLLGLKAASESSLIEAIAHGIGIYCIGKGVFMIAAVTNLKAAIDFVARRLRP